HEWAFARQREPLSPSQRNLRAVILIVTLSAVEEGSREIRFSISSVTAARSTVTLSPRQPKHFSKKRKIFGSEKVSSRHHDLPRNSPQRHHDLPPPNSTKTQKPLQNTS